MRALLSRRSDGALCSSREQFVHEPRADVESLESFHFKASTRSPVAAPGTDRRASIRPRKRSELMSMRTTGSIAACGAPFDIAAIENGDKYMKSIELSSLDIAVRARFAASVTT